MFFIFTVMSFIALYYIVDAHGTWVQAVGELVKLESKPQLMTWHGEVGEGTAWQTPNDFLIWSVITGVAWSLVAAVSPWQSSRLPNGEVRACGFALSMYRCDCYRRK